MIAVVNKSTLVSDADVAKMTMAVQVQIDLHVSTMWGVLPQACQFATPKEGDDEIYIFDDSDQAGALGYHSETPSGKVYAKVFAKPVLDDGGLALLGGTANLSIASVLSHEALELLLDRFTNYWVDGLGIAEGSCYALEICDPVESDGYNIVLSDSTPVLVSNFVGPNWFDPMNVEGKRDWLDTTPGPFALAPGGYMIVRSVPGTEQQVFAAVKPPISKMIAKAHPASRTARRCLKL